MSATPEQIEAERERTLDHIRKVQAALDEVIARLTVRAAHHDQSKLEDPELSLFAATRVKPEDTTYGTADYDAMIKAALGNALRHHSHSLWGRPCSGSDI